MSLIRKPGRGRARMALALAGALALPGCTSSVPGIWPLSEPPGPLPAYPTAALSPGQSCLPNGLPAVRNADGSVTGLDALYCAQTYAVAIAAQFAGEQRQLEATQNGGTLALFGLGTAAGIESVVTKAAMPVRNIGLAAASLAGLNASLGVAGQRSAYQAAAGAVACLISIDAALDDAQRGLGKVSEAETAADMQMGDTAVFESLMDSAKTSHNAGAGMLAAMGLQEAGAAMHAMEQAQTADAVLVAATNAAADPARRARSLQGGVAGVEATLSDSLAKLVDISKIYSQAKAGYASLADSVPAAQMAAKTANAQASQKNVGMVMAASKKMLAGAHAKAMPAVTMEMVAHAAGMMPSVQASTTSHVMAAQKLTDTVSSCAADAPSTPQTSPSSTIPAG